MCLIVALKQFQKLVNSDYPFSPKLTDHLSSYLPYSIRLILLLAVGRPTKSYTFQRHLTLSHSHTHTLTLSHTLTLTLSHTLTHSHSHTCTHTLTLSLTLTLTHSHTCTHNPHCISHVTDFRGSCRPGQTLIHYVCILHATELRTINLQNRLSGSAIYTIQLIWSVWMDWGRGIPPDPSSHVFQFISYSLEVLCTICQAYFSSLHSNRQVG